tara:strand:- start:244 stop:408 length:165 start_codon:yes stop_codon:yes gene_type:complete
MLPNIKKIEIKKIKQINNTINISKENDKISNKFFNVSITLFLKELNNWIFCGIK